MQKKRIYKINLNIIWIVVFVIAMTVGLKSISNMFTTDGNTVSVVKEVEQVSLNDFLSGYQAGQYEVIKMKNQTDLEGHILLDAVDSGTGSRTIPLMTLNKKVTLKDYRVLKTTKPIESSLNDL